MKANNITCLDYVPIADNQMVLKLKGINASDALQADWSIINITTDDGDLVESFGGYAARSVTLDTLGNLELLVVSGDDATTLKAINQLLEGTSRLNEELAAYGELLQALIEEA